MCTEHMCFELWQSLNLVYWPFYLSCVKRSLGVRLLRACELNEVTSVKDYCGRTSIEPSRQTKKLARSQQGRLRDGV